jgi:hypothetical protein
MTAVPLTPPLSSAADVRGSTVPRMFTPPRWAGPPGPCGCGCPLDEDTSRGFEVLAFAREVLGVALLPWQRWWLIHAFELATARHPVTGTAAAALPDAADPRRPAAGKAGCCGWSRCGRSTCAGRPWCWARPSRSTLPGSAGSGDRHGPRGTGDGGRDPGAGGHPLRQRRAVPHPVRRAALPDHGGTRGAGRGLTVDVLLLDELREHRDHLAWAALSKTTLARPDALICAVATRATISRSCSTICARGRWTGSGAAGASRT